MFSWYIDSYEHLNNQFPLHQRIQERERVVYIRTLMLENIKNQDIVTVCNFTSFTLEIFKLKLKTIHNVFCPYKRQSSMLCFIAFRFPRTPVVKRAIGKAKLHKLPMYNEYMCLCWVSTLFFMIYCNSCTTYTQYTASIPWYNVFPALWTFHVLMFPYSSQWSRSAFYRGIEHLWIVQL